jgi:hypothetical protein
MHYYKAPSIHAIQVADFLFVQHETVRPVTIMAIPSVQLLAEAVRVAAGIGATIVTGKDISVRKASCQKQ